MCACQVSSIMIIFFQKFENLVCRAIQTCRLLRTLPISFVSCTGIIFFSTQSYIMILYAVNLADNAIFYNNKMLDYDL